MLSGGKRVGVAMTRGCRDLMNDENRVAEANLVLEKP